MIDKLAKNECCGCNACGDICPNESISFNKDEEGFLYPHINYETCIQCNLCEKVCPIINIGDLKRMILKSQSVMQLSIRIFTLDLIALQVGLSPRLQKSLSRKGFCRRCCME